MTELTVLLNSYHSGANAWFALGEARGYFAEEGIEATFVKGSGAYRAPMLLAEGGYDLAFGDMTSLIALSANDPGRAPAAIYAVHHRGPSAIAVPADGPIHAPRDPEGRHLIGHASDVALRSFPAYARLAGVDPGRVDISVSDDPMAGMLMTMLAGGADGVFGYVSSQKAVLRQAGPGLAERLRFLTFPEVAPNLYGSMIMAARVALKVKPDAVRAFLRAVNRSLIAAVGGVEAAVDAVLERNGALDRAIEIDRWAGTIAEELDHPETAALGFGAIDAARMQRSADLLAETIPLPRAPLAAELFDPGFLPPLGDRLELAEACRGRPSRQ